MGSGENNRRGDAPLAIRIRRELSSIGPDHAAHMEEIDLQRQIEVIQAASAQPRVTTWRRLLFLWLRIYQWEQVPGHKAKSLDLRIPLPLPLVGGLLRSQISWDQAVRVVRSLWQGDRDEDDLLDAALASAMPVEFLRIQEEKTNKKEILVIGLD